jgi:hypothetical protein
LQADGEAVRAAVTLDWSNGQTEGQINRLKTLNPPYSSFPCGSLCRGGVGWLERR